MRLLLIGGVIFIQAAMMLSMKYYKGSDRFNMTRVLGVIFASFWAGVVLGCLT